MIVLLLLVFYTFCTTMYLVRRQLAQSAEGHLRLISAISYVCFLFPAGVLVSLLYPIGFSISWLNLVILILVSSAFPLFQVLAFAASKHVDAGVFNIINNLAPFFTILVVLGVIGEVVTRSQWLGIVLIITSGVLVTIPYVRKFRNTDALGVGIAVLATAILGVGLGIERYLLLNVDFGTYLLLGWGCQMLWSLYLARNERAALKQVVATAARRKAIAVYGGSFALMSVSFIVALKIAPSASVFVTATNFSSVVVVLAAYLILKEKDHLPYKLGAAAVGIIGLLLLTT